MKKYSKDIIYLFILAFTIGGFSFNIQNIKDNQQSDCLQLLKEVSNFSGKL